MAGRKGPGFSGALLLVVKASWSCRLQRDAAHPFADRVWVEGKTLHPSGRIGLSAGSDAVPASVEEEAHRVIEDVQRVRGPAEMGLQVSASDVDAGGAVQRGVPALLQGAEPPRAFIGSGTLLSGARGLSSRGQRLKRSGVAILRGMADPVAGLGAGRWGLVRARAVARAIEADRRKVRGLVAMAFAEDVELRKRAADVMRRVTEKDAAPLRSYADELGGLLVELPVEESRTRWHMGLVVARVAHTREQRLRAARLMSLLVEDESNVVRCSGVEGMGELALGEASLRGEAEELMARALLDGTKAMKCRARAAQRRLAQTG